MSQSESVSFEPPEEITVFWRTSGEFCPSSISEISRTGAFIRTSRPEPLGTVVGIRLDAPGREICVDAVVRRVIPNQGMGVEFSKMPHQERLRLDILVRQMEMAALSQAAAAQKASQTPPAEDSAPTPANAPPSRSRKSSSERRSRTRCKFSAPVELAESGSNEPVQGELINLGRGGCYVKLEQPLAAGTAVDIVISHNGEFLRTLATVSSSQPGKGMGLKFGEIDAADRPILERWLVEAMERHWLASNRRRSQRVMVSIPVRVEATNSRGTDVSEEAKTVSISAHGALLQLEMSVIKGQTITLRNPSTNDALECSVDYLGAAQNGRREVGVSFVQPNRTLWQVAFPPADWSPQDPYAKVTKS